MFLMSAGAAHRGPGDRGPAALQRADVVVNLEELGRGRLDGKDAAQALQRRLGLPD